MSEMTGQCLCGIVTFTAKMAETDYRVCHCAMCRRWAGGPLFAADAETVTFAGEDKIGRYRSSDWAERGFCTACGANLFYYLMPAEQYILAIGAFDDAEAFRMASEIFIDNKPGGYAFAGDHPRLTEAQCMAKYAPPAD